MAHRVTVTVSRAEPPANWLARTWRTVRSYVQGPWSLKDPELTKMFGGGRRSVAGPVVNEITSFMVAAFYDGVNQISSDVAKLPLDLRKRRNGGGSDDYVDSKTYKLMKYSPNPEMRTMVFRRAVTMHALVYGNGYAQIERDALGQPNAVYFIHATRVRPKYIDSGGGRKRLVYEIDGDENKRFPPSDMLHIPSLADDGIVGMELIHVAREALGLALASQQFAAAFFGNGTRFGGILTAEDRDFDPGDEDAEEIREQVEKLNARADKAFRLLVLGGAWKYHATGTKPSDAQMKEIREQQVVEIARYLNMPPHKLKELSRSTNNNIEAQDLEYYKGTLLNWITLWEQELDAKLVPTLERGRQFFKHNVNAFLRGTMKERAEALGIMRDKGIINADQWRELEDMNPQEDGQGKLYLVQSAQIPVNKIGPFYDAQIEASKAKATPPEPPPAPASDSSATDDRAARAEQLAADALADAQAEREKRIAAEASGTASAETIARLTESEAQSQAIAAQLGVLAAELRSKADSEQAAREAIATQLAEVTADAAAAAQRLEASTTELATARAEQAAAEAARLEADARAQAAVAEAEQAARDAHQARQLAEGVTNDRDAQEAAAIEAERRAGEALTAAHAATEALERISAESVQQLQREADAIAAAAQARLEAETLQARVAELTAAAEDARAGHQTLEARTTELDATRQALETQLAELRQTLEAERAATKARMTGTVAAHRALIVDVVSRMTRRECEQARNKQATPAKLRRWLDGFAALHEAICLEALLPAMRTHLAWSLSADDPTEVTRALVREHIALFTTQLGAVLDEAPEDFHASLDRVLERWESERADVVADALLLKQIEQIAGAQ